MKNWVSINWVLALSVLLGAYANAADTGLRLTDDIVKQFVGAMVAVEDWSEKHSVEEMDMVDEETTDFSVESMSAMAQRWWEKNKDTPQGKDFMSIINKHGFADINEYITTVSAVMSAYVSYKMDEQNIDMDAQLASARASLDNNPNIPPEMRKQILSSLEQSAAMVRQMKENTNPHNVEVVKRNAGLIEGALQ